MKNRYTWYKTHGNKDMLNLCMLGNMSYTDSVAPDQPVQSCRYTVCLFVKEKLHRLISGQCCSKIRMLIWSYTVQIWQTLPVIGKERIKALIISPCNCDIISYWKDLYFNFLLKFNFNLTSGHFVSNVFCLGNLSLEI